MLQTGVLPQICLMTLWGAPNPLLAKVAGVYKHSTVEVPGNVKELQSSVMPENTTYYSLSGMPLSSPSKGINIVRIPNGKSKKVIVL